MKSLSLVNTSSKSEPADDGHNSPARIAETVRLMRMQEVLELTGMCRSTLYNKLKKAAFVRPIAIGERSIRFSEAEVYAWIKERMDARAGGTHG